jgi:hypothetical protein
VQASKPPRTHQANAVEAASKPSAHASNPPPEPASKPLDPFCQRRPPLSRVEQRAVKRSTDLALSQCVPLPLRGSSASTREGESDRCPR